MCTSKAKFDPAQFSVPVHSLWHKAVAHAHAHLARHPPLVMHRRERHGVHAVAHLRRLRCHMARATIELAGRDVTGRACVHGRIGMEATHAWRWATKARVEVLRAWVWRVHARLAVHAWRGVHREATHMARQCRRGAAALRIFGRVGFFRFRLAEWGRIVIEFGAFVDDESAHKNRQARSNTAGAKDAHC